MKYELFLLGNLSVTFAAQDEHTSLCPISIILKERKMTLEGDMDGQHLLMHLVFEPPEFAHRRPLLHLASRVPGGALVSPRPDVPLQNTAATALFPTVIAFRSTPDLIPEGSLRAARHAPSPRDSNLSMNADLIAARSFAKVPGNIRHCPAKELAKVHVNRPQTA
jgi:hypothetical protein